MNQVYLYTTLLVEDVLMLPLALTPAQGFMEKRFVVFCNELTSEDHCILVIRCGFKTNACIVIIQIPILSD